MIFVYHHWGHKENWRSSLNHFQESRIIPYQSNAIIRTFQSGDEVAFHNLNESWILESFSMDGKDRIILGDPVGRVLKAGGENLGIELEPLCGRERSGSPEAKS
jgi:hypothetical protein